MKTWLVCGAAFIVLMAGAGIWRSYGKDAVPAEASSGHVLGIETLMRHADRYRSGPVLVEGVVSATDPAAQTLSLIDTTEFRNCGDTDCATLTLPVRWAGPMPQKQSLVRAKGSVRKQANRFVFVAQTLEKMKPAAKAAQ